MDLLIGGFAIYPASSLQSKSDETRDSRDEREVGCVCVGGRGGEGGGEEGTSCTWYLSQPDKNRTSDSIHVVLTLPLVVFSCVFFQGLIGSWILTMIGFWNERKRGVVPQRRLKILKCCQEGWDQNPSPRLCFLQVHINFERYVRRKWAVQRSEHNGWSVTNDGKKSHVCLVWKHAGIPYLVAEKACCYWGERSPCKTDGKKRSVAATATAARPRRNFA